MQSVEEDKTVWCGNLSEEVTDEILYELFIQAGPVESLRRPKDQSGRPKSFAFIVYKHDCSVPYSLELFRGVKLFNRIINLNSRSTLRYVPVLDTHITEFTEPRNYMQNAWGNEPVNYRNRESDHMPRREDFRNKNYRREDQRKDSYRREDQRNDNYRREDQRNDNYRRGDHRQSTSRRHEEKDTDEPTSWAEFNALRGKGSLVNGYRSDLQGRQAQTSQSSNKGPHQLDFDALLQMGHQMVIPQQLIDMGSMLSAGGMLPMGLGPNLGGNMFPSMQGRMSGGEHRMPERDGRGRDYHDRRDSRRGHPYNDRGRNESRDDHRRHDRGYSSSRSSHDREKRDRRSR